jgi:pyrroline-5-carboxylate reductase
MKTRKRKLGFIGAGNMAGALVKGVLRAGLYRSRDLWVTDPLALQRGRMRRRYGVQSASDNRELVRGSEIVVLAVKPQVLSDVLSDVRAEVTPAHLVVSIAAGVTLRRLEAALGGEARVIRVMPNTPALVGKGMSVLVRGSKPTASDLRTAMRLFRGVGDAIAVDEEGLLDPVTGLSGSGPAYVYRFAEVLIDAGVGQALPADVAKRLVFRTIEGAAAMLLETGMTPKELREMVSSPGGTTLAGLAALEGAGFGATVNAAVSAATRRSRELAGS